MEWLDTALVLRVGRFRETDLWLRLLTKQHGVISAFAFGGSRSRKRFSGCLDLLNVIQVRARDSRGGTYLNLEEGSLLEGPRRLRQDWKRLGMLMNCVRFLEALGVAPDNAHKAFSLTRHMLQLSEQAEQVREALPVLFRLRLASDQGYVPDFSLCSQCGSVFRHTSGDHACGPIWFCVESGTVLCATCHAASGMHNASSVSETVLGALQTVQTQDPADWNELVMAPYDWRACARLADGFVQFHLGLSWEKGRFRKQ